MTYRELYAQNCQRDAGKNCHIGNCPDTWLADLTKQPKCKINCPPDGVTTGDSSACARCWDQQIPDGAPLPEWAKAADSEIRVTVTGENIHVHTDGTPDGLVHAALAAMHYVAREVYQAGKDWKSAEELIHMLQQALLPTSAIWDFSEGGGGDA